MFWSFSAPSRNDCDFFCCIRGETVHSFFAVPAAVKLRMSEATLRHAMWLVFSGSLHVSTQKNHMTYQLRACVCWVQKALDVFTRSHHKNVSKPMLKDVDNLPVCTFGSWKVSGDLTCWMFIINVIWPHVETMTTEEVVDNQETHTNSIFDSSCTPGKISREFF